ncbi:ATP-dependent DNA ligase [Ralstonia nicotianae]
MGGSALIPQGFKPNLAAMLTKPELIKFPVWASPKIDGVRCVIFGGVAYSRSLKPIPNPFVQEWAAANCCELEGLDGELVVGSATASDCMQNTTSGVMKKTGEPDFSFHAFDFVGTDWPFATRCEQLERWRKRGDSEAIRVHIVSQELVTDQVDLAMKEAQFLDEGYEGMMIRAHDGRYKFGRSTEREGGLVKVKRFDDAEAEVIGYEEEMHNANEAKTNALGQTERSTVQANLVGKRTLGALVCRTASGVAFSVGTGFSSADRASLWRERAALVGRVVKYKHFDHGTVDAPRHPVFLGFRAPEDMA